MIGDPKPPDLQEWTARYGGYRRIPWDQWDKAVEDWRRARRAVIQDEVEVSRGQKTKS
jgi:hypothetical protein